MTTLLEGFVMLLPWFREDISERDAMDCTTWFRWGYIRAWHGGSIAWYIRLALPIYPMLVPLESWFRPIMRRPPTLHQTHLAFFEAIGEGRDLEHRRPDGWQFFDVELP